MNDKSGIHIIEGLLDRNYLKQFKQIDPIEQKKVIMIAIKTTSILFDKRFKSKLNLVMIATKVTDMHFLLKTS